jgi:curli biogenesis system outer membrane secretion channel CsgG
MVERGSLDAVLKEQKFQMSGNVDDDSVISLGKLSGAETVLTGSISGYGENRRLTVKALDVKTGEIQAMTSQKF